jgi:hypothetical protein
MWWVHENDNVRFSQVLAMILESEKRGHMPESHPPFFSDCVGWPKGRLGALDLLIEESDPISLDRFRAKIGPGQMRHLTRGLGYGRTGIRIEEDHHVRCARHWSGAVMLIHSAIEHVFAPPELIDALQERYEADRDRRAVSPETLILVHPGSICGSARAQLGRAEADAARAEVLDRVASHEGPLFVIDGALSDELSPRERDLITASVRRSAEAGRPAARVWGCDSGERPFPGWAGSRTDGGRLVFDGQEEAATDLAPLIPAGLTLVTGAWAGSNARDGCVNSVANAVRAVLGREAPVGIDETALLMPPEFEEPSP